MPSLIPEITNSPGTHVLVIGVSEYLHFDDGPEPTQNGALLGMSQLSSAARSASEFAAWILGNYNHSGAPLSSLRVLLSPAPGEDINPTIAPLLQGDASATLANVESELIEFRQRCDQFTDNVAIVYVAGHGVQLTKAGSIVLLHDCGSNAHATVLKGAIDMASVRAGFNHPNTARTQFWFVDACRQAPAIARRFESMDGGLTLDEPAGAAEATAWFIAATTGTQAYARVGGLTLFCEAFLWGLDDHIAAEPEPGLSDHWHVSSHALVKKLRPRVKELAAAENAEQTVDSIVTFDDALFHEYPIVPNVELTVTLAPNAAVAGSQGFVLDGQNAVIAESTNGWPMQEELAAGMYRIQIDTPAGFDNYGKLHNLRPPSVVENIDVTP